MTERNKGREAFLNAYAHLSPTGVLHHFIGINQRRVLFSLLGGEEGDSYAKLICELADRVSSMPVTYEQDGKGMDALVYLHYFIGGADFFITEKDMSADEDEGKHHQAFGWVSLNGVKEDGELGYISLPEILACAAEIDLHWHVQTVREAIK